LYFVVGKRSGSCSHTEGHENRTEAEKCLLECQKRARLAGKVIDKSVIQADSLEEILDSFTVY
jgi:hypothetical protein